MFVEIAIGDAYGAGFEFSERSKIVQHNNLRAYSTHDKESIPTGCYTDDTQMSIAVGETLLLNDYSADVFAGAFVRCYNRDRRMGYASGFQKLLDTCDTGKKLRSTIEPNSIRNGAAMRSVPLGVLTDVEIIKVAASNQASVTHNTQQAILSSQVVALMSHYLLREKASVSDLRALIERETKFVLSDIWASDVECDAIQTIHAAHTALVHHRKMSELLLACVDFGGDVDSVAAIALGLASLTADYESDLPAFLYEELEDGPYGKRFIKDLEARIMRKHGLA